MSKQSSAYGKPAGDTDFRKTRDVDEYAARAKEREAAEKAEAKARYEAKLAGRRYYKPMDGTETQTTARTTTQDLNAMVGKVQLVPAGAGVGRRGRGAGIYCEACDLTFKDNVQWVEVRGDPYRRCGMSAGRDRWRANDMCSISTRCSTCGTSARRAR